MKTEIESDSHSYGYIRCKVPLEVSCKYEMRLFHAAHETVAGTLLNVFIASTAKVGWVLKSALFRPIKTVLLDMAEKGALDNAFHFRLDPWKKSTSFMNKLIGGALTFPRFMYPVAYSNKTHTGKTVYECCRTAKAKEITLAKLKITQLSVAAHTFIVCEKRRRSKHSLQKTLKGE